MGNVIKIKKRHLKIFVLLVLIFLVLLAYTTYDGKKEAVKKEVKTVREPAVAGTWYPGDQQELTKTINLFMENAKKVFLGGDVKALIVPHAGYKYSGIVAAYGFKNLEHSYKTVIVLGPTHHIPLEGVSIANVTHYKTPLGEIKLSDKIKELRKENIIKAVPEAHSKEHSIEMQLPFLQRSLEEFELIPMIVGKVNSEEFANILIKYLDNTTLLVVSVDLSHYHPYDQAVALDKNCLEAIHKVNRSKLQECEIDATWAVSALLYVAEKLGWNNKVILYANSGDITEDKSRVVGYSAVAFFKEQGLTKEEQDILLKLARDTMELYVRYGKVLQPDMSVISRYPNLLKKQGAFVSLNKLGRLRGSIGHLVPIQQLYLDIRDNAINAVANDQRFKPVEPDELADITVTISVLTVPSLVEVDSYGGYLEELVPFVDGIIIKTSSGRTSTYLPQVWGHFSTTEEFLSALCIKQKASENCWKDDSTSIYRYHAQVFSE